MIRIGLFPAWGRRLAPVLAAAALAMSPLRAIDPPANPAAIPEVHALLNYMASIHGQYVLSGQQETVNWFGNDDPTEMNHLLSATGKLPAIRGFDYLFVADPRNTYQRVAERAIQWSRDGGIVTISFHWFMEVNSPNGPAFYTQGAHATQYTHYDIRQAVIAGTPEHTEFITEMDKVAADLRKLNDAGVPVIWRPFHEAGGTWFWWSRHGAQPFVAAWRMMYDRFTNVHKLNNLIWEFNPNDLAILTGWYPGDGYVDMISIDVYPGSGHPVFAAEYRQYRDFTQGRKLVAMSENGRIPDPDQIVAEGAWWAYFCTWSGSFITGDTENSLAFKQAVFNHARVLTRDELPKVLLWGRAPQFTRQPASHALEAGASVTLTAAADANGAITYQWYRGTTALTGQTGASLALGGLQPSDTGLYSVRATSSLGTTTSHASALVVGARDGRIDNLSTRGLVRTGDELMIAGFVLSGSGDRTVLIRGVGPRLVRFGIDAGTVLADPAITLYSGGTPIRSNDSWQIQTGGGVDVAPVAASVGAFGFDEGSSDAALVATLSPGRYTVHVTGAAGSTGIALAELYDASDGAGGARLTNLSTRGYASTGNAIMIPGIVVGDAGRTLLIRGIGPGLSSSGLSPLLADPVLRVVDAAGQTIVANDDWGSASSAPALAAAFVQTGAFGLANGSKDAALVVTLPPGQYTALVSDRRAGSGIALVEVYEMAP